MSTLPYKERVRRQYTINGVVQGVGYRPFVFRLATKLALNGWVRNNASGVVIELEGSLFKLANFENCHLQNLPPNAVLDSLEVEELPLQNDPTFRIIESDQKTTSLVSIPPDSAVCFECLTEMNDPANRRFRYPFINCSHCGPRFTIITGLPYDRPQTTMAQFELCNTCGDEYKDPLDRRFHAQTLACAECGPHLELWAGELVDGKKCLLASHDDALKQAVKVVKKGDILALKGLGGFQLIADACNEKAVETLRQRKQRPRKPFALMMASLEEVIKHCEISEPEAVLLQSPQSPIVLMHKKNNSGLTEAVAPGNPNLGVMLPCTPLHHLLLQELATPIIATSGNRSNEPICINEHEALVCLSGIADVFLVHDRPIKHRADDSIVRVMSGANSILRRGRGYAPLSFSLNQKQTVGSRKSALAVGGHLKNTVALGIENKLILSPYIGDLNSVQACDVHEDFINNLSDFYKVKPDIIARDKHPDYASTRFAELTNKTIIPVQHHYAHALSCLLDNTVEPPALAVVWDGNGYGDDGTVWGGEFLEITEDRYERVFSLRQFPMPGGDAAAKTPGLAAFGLLYEAGITRDSVYKDEERMLLQQALEKNINCPLTSSMGRLFDAVAALSGLAEENSFEGEAAMALEFAAGQTAESYPFELIDRIVDWAPMLNGILWDLDNSTASSIISGKFHNTLATIIVSIAERAGQQQVLLTGGCFQNKLLLESAVEKLTAAGFEPFWHHRIPTNDGGIAAGQIMAALKVKQSGKQTRKQ